ncbi:MAG: mercuric ion binding protein [Patiriisocius sp.]|jgi:cation transport ATPase
MKNILVVLVLLMGSTVFGQHKNAKAIIPVDGVCVMCKDRIEKASIKTKGVKSAVWNIETKELSVIYDERKTTLATINASVANVGHDTEQVKATEEAYASVHPCCKYRDEKVQEDHNKDN